MAKTDGVRVRSPVAGAVSDKGAARLPKGALTYQEPKPPEPVDVGDLARRLVIGTATVLGVCVASLWLARGWLRHARPAGKAQGRMRVLDTLPLSRRGCLQLVEIEQRLVLIASDAGGIKSVTPLPQPFADQWEKWTEQPVTEESLAAEPVAARRWDQQTER